METDFEPGDLIRFAGDLYVVHENHGTSGIVSPVGEETKVKFYWLFQGEKCKIVMKKGCIDKPNML